MPISTQPTLQRDEINERVRTEPQAFIALENGKYTRQVEALAETIIRRFPGRGIVLLCGPSSAGKTTTAAGLQHTLRREGRDVYTISLDNFYKGRGKAPRLPDGSFDYESVDALDLELLERCVNELLSEGYTTLPEFDFHSGFSKPNCTPLSIGETSLVIFEGIHALDPTLGRHLPQSACFRVYLDTLSPIYDGKEVLLTSRELRLCRRLLRDARFRNSPPENTLDMWRQVVRGEELYLYPYVSTADATLNTTHAYEPALWSFELLPQLRKLTVEPPFDETVERLIDGLIPFETLSPAILPRESLLREFLGQ